MNFNLNREVRKVLELIAQTPALRRMAWMSLVIGLVWVLPPLITAIRWW